MSSQAEIDEALKVFQEKTPVPPRARSRWRPQFSLGTMVLLVMLVAMSAAFLAYRRAKQNELETLEKKLRGELAFYHSLENSFSLLTHLPNHYNLGHVHVCSDSRNGFTRNFYSILVYLNPEKDYLLHYATKDIPAESYPAAQATYHIKAVGHPQDSRNYIRLHLGFGGKAPHYGDYEHPFEGHLRIDADYFYFANAGEPGSRVMQNSHTLSIVRDPLTVTKDKKIYDWANLFLEGGNRGANISPGRPTQLLRIRSNTDPEPSAGMMLWIEELGDAPVPDNALPFPK